MAAFFFTIVFKSSHFICVFWCSQD